MNYYLSPPDPLSLYLSKNSSRLFLLILEKQMDKIGKISKMSHHNFFFLKSFLTPPLNKTWRAKYQPVHTNYTLAPCAQCTHCKASILVSLLLTLWDWTYDFGGVGHPLYQCKKLTSTLALQGVHCAQGTLMICMQQVRLHSNGHCSHFARHLCRIQPPP